MNLDCLSSGNSSPTAIHGERAASQRQLIALTLTAQSPAERSSVLITRLFQETGSSDASVWAEDGGFRQEENKQVQADESFIHLLSGMRGYRRARLHSL